MKKYGKTIALLIFVVCSGVLHSCAQEQDNTEVIVREDESLSQEKESETDTQQNPEIYVFITGCVRNPGVYTLAEGTRLYELVELAGGFTEEADTGYLNLADSVKDGEKVIVYSMEQTAMMAGQPESNQQSDAKEGCVNLNTADKATLMTLPGIGEAKAEAIIRYREEQGAFLAIEEIMNISGIKEAAFDKIKHLITV